MLSSFTLAPRPYFHHSKKFFGFAVIFLSACHSPDSWRVTAPEFQAIENSFAIKGVPLSAGVIMPMMERFDEFPAVVVVDVLAAQTRGVDADAKLVTVDLGADGPEKKFEYPPPPRAATRSGIWQWIEPSSEEADHVSYHLVGRLPSGEWVLETAAVANGGTGSGVFVSLVLLRFEQGVAMSWKDAAQPRLQLRLLATHGLGDRSQSIVKIEKGRVWVDGEPLAWPPQSGD